MAPDDKTRLPVHVPDHLQVGAARQQCSRCLRYTYATADFDGVCVMTQHSGQPCGGRFHSPPGCWSAAVLGDSAEPGPFQCMICGLWRPRFETTAVAYRPHAVVHVGDQAIVSDELMMNVTYCVDQPVCTAAAQSGRPWQGRPFTLAAHFFDAMFRDALRDGGYNSAQVIDGVRLRFVDRTLTDSANIGMLETWAAEQARARAREQEHGDGTGAEAGQGDAD
jgi:hypothetical protein